MEEAMIEKTVLHIQTLGPFKTWYQQGNLAWPTYKSKALLQILLVEPGRFVPVDQILEYLWPHLTSQKAQNNLWVTVSQLRRVLQPDLQPRANSAYIHKQGEGYLFNTESDYWLDGDAFATHLVDAQSAIDLTSRIAAWEAACNLYKGDYLEDEPYAEWAQFPRTQWRRRYEQLLENLADSHTKNGRFQQAISYCHKLLTLDNTNETAYRLLMRCHAALGERATALKVYDEAVRALQEEIGVAPMPETAELSHQIQRLEGDWKNGLSGTKGVDIAQSSIPASQPQIPQPFVGRGDEIDLLTQLLTKTTISQGQMVFISGEPGIGKSRLIQEATILASQQGFRPFSVRCYQVEQSMPYQPLIDLVRQILTYGNRWQHLAPVWLSELAILVPEIEESSSTALTNNSQTDELEESRQGRLFQAIFHLFANQAKNHKLMLVIDDIHWADPATLQCLHYMARNIVQVPIIFMLSFQEESLSSSEDLVVLLHSLQRELHYISIPLSRLSEADTRALLAQSGDTAHYADQLSQWLYKETDGNPFFFVTLLRSFQEEGLLENIAKTDWLELARTDPTLTLPEAIRVSVRDRLHRLTKSELEVLNWMAVYGRQLDFSTLQAISHQPQITLLNAVEQLVERQLLIETTGRYDFNHNKIRDVVYHDLSAARCGYYHQHIASTLEASPPSPDKASLLAYHFERGDDSKKALVYWMQAGKHALDIYAYEQAVQHYERVLALTDEVTAQIDAYLGLGNAFMLLDDHMAAENVIQQGLNLVERHADDERRIQLLYARAQNTSRQHRPDGGKPEVKAALTAAEQAGEEHYLAECLLLLTEVHESNGDLSSALKTANQARVVSSKLNDSHLEARAMVEIGFLHAQRAEFNEAVNTAERGLKLLAKVDDRNAIAYTWNILGRALGGRGDYSRAFDAFQCCQEEAQIIGDRYLLAQLFNMRGWLYRELLDYKTALKFDKQGIDFAKRWGKPSPEVSARLNVCLDVLHLGDVHRALILLDEIEAQTNAGSFGFHNWRWRLRLLHARGLGFLELNEPEKALGLADESLQLANVNLTRKYVALNYDLKGMAQVKLGNVDKAIATMEAAVSLADEIQYQPIRWSCRQRLAGLYRQSGHELKAKRTLLEAEHIIHTIAKSLADENLRVTFLNAALS
jgi:predicted ATPase/DNA-binding SARP family transcriptional activator